MENKNLKSKTLWENEWFSVVEKTDENGAMMSGLEPKGINVVVLPYTLGEDGLVDKIGVHYEINPLWGEGLQMTAVTGNVEEVDDDVVNGAIRELEEESGIIAADINRWRFLGMVNNSKVVSQEQPCFAVDVTGLDITDKKGDGTVNEQLSHFELVEVKKALFETQDMYIPTLFMRLFRESIEEGLGGSKEAEGEEREDKIEGGLADNSLETEFDDEQLNKGIEVELEHTDDRDVAKEIAMDHLKEDPKYYDKLETIHKEEDSE